MLICNFKPNNQRLFTKTRFIFLLFHHQANVDSFTFAYHPTAFAIPGSASGCLALGLGAMDGPGPQGGAAGIKAPYNNSIKQNGFINSTW